MVKRFARSAAAGSGGEGIRPRETIADVEAEDLLRRPPVAPPLGELKEFYRGKTVLVTGAGGSIGSELSRQLGGLGPARLVLFERHEYGLYRIEMEMRRAHPATAIVPAIGDVLDRSRLAEVFGEHRPQVVFHAAAYKHVPMMEANPHEAVKVNVLGTKAVARQAMESGVERFVFISSDKAVNPRSVMGTTKRLAEIMLQDFSRASATRFAIVRFGNVLESSGSVVPLFKEQIERGGPVTVTHPDMTRFFMTASEAVHLVLHAAILGEGGDVFVLDMGKPISVLELARQLISLHGYEPGKDIEIAFTGLRPGEKLHEELFNPDETVQPTRHPKIRKAVSRNGRSGWPGVEALLRDDAAAQAVTRSELKRRLAAAIT